MAVFGWWMQKYVHELWGSQMNYFSVVGATVWVGCGARRGTPAEQAGEKV
jgi:hypothetical protein